MVNAGVLPHPVTGDGAVAFVAAGGTRKLGYLRADPTITVVVRAGWQWTAVEGQAQLIGPDDPHTDIDDERLRLLLRRLQRRRAARTTTGTNTTGRCETSAVLPCSWRLPASYSNPT